jgi:hypothetical protein
MFEEALGLAIGPWHVWHGEDVAQAEGFAGFCEGF